MGYVPPKLSPIPPIPPNSPTEYVTSEEFKRRILARWKGYSDTHFMSLKYGLNPYYAKLWQWEFDRRFLLRPAISADIDDSKLLRPVE